MKDLGILIGKIEVFTASDIEIPELKKRAS
jgi:hypothetical protein